MNHKKELLRGLWVVTKNENVKFFLSTPKK